MFSLLGELPYELINTSCLLFDLVVFLLNVSKFGALRLQFQHCLLKLATIELGSCG
jgi:hypothetical protein